MSKLTRFCAISLLVLSMSALTFAGEMQGPGAPEPPPPGEMQGPGAPTSSTTPSGDSLSSDYEIIVQGSEELARWVLDVL